MTNIFKYWLARKVLWLAWWIDKDTRLVCQAGYFKFERGWVQPKPPDAQARERPHDY